MKKLFVTFTICVLAGICASAQELTFLKGDKVAGLGIGLVSTPYRAWSGNHFNKIPLIVASFEMCILDNIINDRSSVGVGGLIGYTSASTKSEYSGYGWSSTYIPINIRGAFHYAFVDNLDTYAGVLVGYNVYSWKWKDYEDTARSSSGGLTSSLYVGARYYFTESIGVFGDVNLGYSTLSLLNLGIAIKF